MAAYMPWLLLLLGVPGWACSCGAYPSAKDAWADSPLVFLGTVEKTEQQTFSDERGVTRFGGQKVKVVVEETFKGATDGEHLSLEQPASNCAPKITEGTRVLFYLHPAKAKGAWEARGCYRTRAINEAADDLLFLRALPWPAERTRLSGVVWAVGLAADGNSPTLTSLPGVRVLVRSAGNLVETTTNGQGVYELFDLPAANYELDVQVPKGYQLSSRRVTGARLPSGGLREGAFPVEAGRGVSADFYLAVKP